MSVLEITSLDFSQDGLYSQVIFSQDLTVVSKYNIYLGLVLTLVEASPFI